MIKASTYKTPASIIESIRYLIDLLKAEKKKFELAAATVADTQFSQSISVLAQENNQYESELASQLQMLGATVNNEVIQPVDTTQPVNTHDTATGTILPGQILQFCRESEKQLIYAYRRILNEPFLAEGLRTLIRKQLNGLLYAFLQLKLLNTTDFFVTRTPGAASIH